MKVYKQIYQTLASLKLAVISLLSLASILAVATVLESYYGMRAVHNMVYGQYWFAVVLFILGANVFCAASIRYPWKKNQLGFVITHTGILTILLGSFITQLTGVDGSLPIREGSQNNQIVLDNLYLNVFDSEGQFIKGVRVPESGNRVKKKLITLKMGEEEKVVVSEFIPRSIAQKKVVETTFGVPSILIEISNSKFTLQEWISEKSADKPTEVLLGPAKITFGNSVKQKESEKLGFLKVIFEGKEYRLPLSKLNSWERLEGTPFSIKILKVLPQAIVENKQLITKSNQFLNPAIQFEIKNDSRLEKHTVFQFFPEFSTLNSTHTKKGTEFGVDIQWVREDKQNKNLGQLNIIYDGLDRGLRFSSFGRDGKLKNQSSLKVGKKYSIGWMDLNLEVKKYYPHSKTFYEPKEIVEISSGDNSFTPAIKIESGETSQWLFEGQTTPLYFKNRSVFLQFSKEILVLPFSIYLEKFTIGNDPGTTKAASYQSDVIVKDIETKKALISMNEPLKWGGYTFYQASYQLDEERPLSILAVNKDPGRFIKYLGCLIMVLGILVMFYRNPHYLNMLFGRKP